MIWKTTNSFLVNSLSEAICNLKIYGISLPVLTLLFFLGNIYNGFSQQDTADCEIAELGCPPDDLIEPCGNVTFEDVLGNYVDWTEPDYSLDCGDETGYSYQISFDLPESQEECWSFHKVQRNGTNNGTLSLWKSNSNASGTAAITSPSFYINEEISGSLDIVAETDQDFKVDVYLIDPAGNKSDILDTFDVIGNDVLTNYGFEIDPANFNENIIFRVRFELNALSGTNLNNKNYIELISIDAGLFGVACAAEANFAVTKTHNPGDFFPVGTTTVTYTATCNGCTPVLEESCSFDVIVNPTPDAPSVTTSLIEECDQGQELDANLALVNTVDVVWYDALEDGNVVSNPTLSTTGTVKYYAEKVVDDCPSLTRTAVTLTLNETPAKPVVTSTTDTTCDQDNGSITFTVEAGLTYTLTDTSNNTYTHSSGVYSNLPAGTYSLVAGTENCDSQSTEVVISATDDTENPSLSISGNRSEDTDEGEYSADITISDAIFSDNCSGALLTWEMTGATSQSGNGQIGTFSFNIGVTTVEYTVTDASDNTTTATLTVTVTDNENPTISCPATVVVDADAGECFATEVNLGTPTGTDNCDTDLVFTNDAPATFTIGNTTVTWIATDDAGNTISCEQTVTVEDNENPTISCPATVVVDADAGECFATGINLGTPTGTDNCDNDLVFTNDAPATFPIGNTTVTWIATDEAGNTISCEQTVTVEDNEDPIVETMNNITVNSDAGVCGAVVNFGMIGATDNCEIASVEVTEGLVSGSEFPIGTTTVTWTVTDASGNSVTTSFDVIVTDNENPVISCPGDMTVPAEEGQNYAIVNFADATAADNCNVTVEQTGGAASGSQFTLGQHEIEFTATDENGNTAVCTFTINVTDGQPPVINCPGDISQNVDEGICGAVVTFETPDATDNSGSVTVEQTEGPTSGSVFPVGTTTITFTATDEDDNSVSCSFDIIITDNEAPVITCPGDVTIGSETGMCSVSLENLELGIATATDNCDGEITISNNAPATFPLGVTDVIWTATDAAGNSVTCTQKVTVEDDEAPVITACAEAITIDADSGVCSASSVALGSITATDNCDSELTITNDAPEVFELGETTVTWTVTDNAGNETTCTQTVTVEDNENPVIAECPGTVTVPADAGLCSASEVDLGMLIATDNCDNDLEFSNDAPEVFELGETTVTWTVADNAGNTTSCTQTVTVVDDQAPVVETMNNIEVDSDADVCGAVVNFGMIGATDNCEIASVEVTEGLTSGSIFPIGTTSVTWTVTDASGNTATSSFTVTVNDNEAPAISCPSNMTVSTETNVSYATVDFNNATATDNCEVTVEQTAGPASGSQFPIGDTSISFTATDAAGNTTECSFTVTVEDNENPTLECPANITQGVDAGICGAAVEFATPTGFDNSGNVSVTQTAGPASGEIFPVGTTTVSFTATDEAGNTVTCSFTVTVNDDEGPQIEDMDGITVNTDAGTCGAIVNFETPAATDNCGVESVVLTEGQNSGSEFPVGETTITYTATDTAGNTATSSFTVTVVDNEAPSITCPQNIEVIVEIGTTSAAVEYEAVTTTDNCEGTTVELTEGIASGEEFPLGTTTVTYTVTDAAGNSTSCTFTVIVEEEELPAPPAAPGATVTTAATCASPTGTITVETQEGLTYSIDGENYQESGVFAELAPGTYEITARDEFGQVSEVTVITIDEPVATEIQTMPVDLCIEDGVFDLFELLVGEFDETGTWIDTDNTGALDNGFIDPAMFELGSYTFTYQVEGNCPSTTDVTVSINDDCIVLDCSIEDLKDSISKAVTPNGDNRNDFFTVDLDTACGFTYDLMIFNRWGAKVFDAPNYQNNWDGYSESSFTSSNQLPSGTYYYVLEIRNSDFAPIQGYIYLGTK